jgi:preprotein translocase subunit SecB
MTETTENNNQPVFNILAVYTKDVSFESPASPATYDTTSWHPNAAIDISPRHQKVKDDIYSCILKVSLTVKVDDNTVFIAEVEQAADFKISGLDEEKLEQILNTYCPNVIFPYARQNISDLTTKGGFPPLYLSPVDFEAQYLAKKNKQEAESTAS